MKLYNYTIITLIIVIFSIFYYTTYSWNNWSNPSYVSQWDPVIVKDWNNLVSSVTYLNNEVELYEKQLNIVFPYRRCKNDWEILEDYTSYWSCDSKDIIICKWEGEWYSLSACNLWTNVSWLWEDSFWNYYTREWASCLDGYHIPTKQEMEDIFFWYGWDYDMKAEKFKFPKAWIYNLYNSNVINKFTQINYLTSSPSNWNVESYYYLSLPIPGWVMRNLVIPSFWSKLSARCIKD